MPGEVEVITPVNRITPSVLESTSYKAVVLS